MTLEEAKQLLKTAKDTPQEAASVEVLREAIRVVITASIKKPG